MHTGKLNPLQLPQNEQYNQITTQLGSGKLIHTQDKFLFPAALNSCNNFATINYEAHINTKIDCSINHVFKSMSVAEINFSYYMRSRTHSILNNSCHVC